MPCHAQPGAVYIDPLKTHLPRQSQAQNTITCGSICTSDVLGVAKVLEMPNLMA